ncbi:MAG: hypothetical protein P0Y64_13075 [Candidatus Sphingomonas colombiensis]|nr:hypothetical protein [Sphingomonas sp.]WEK42320.1 MAG: hypothetical protein P0Y64_13075 [Sphingomonas sp.]
MTRAAVVFLIAALAGCGRASHERAAQSSGAGAQLERAAITAGVVADPTRLDPVGAYSSASDRICILRARGGYRIGASVDYGEGHGCVARGTARGLGKLAIAFGGGCRFDARFDGGRLVFPPVLPEGCDSLCTGRASLSALVAARLSEAKSEAATLRGPDGKPLCG